MKKTLIGALAVLFVVGLWTVNAEAQYKPVWEGGKVLTHLDFERKSWFTIKSGDGVATAYEQRWLFGRKWDRNIDTPIWTYPIDEGAAEVNVINAAETSGGNIIAAWIKENSGAGTFNIKAKKFDGATGLGSSWTALITDNQEINENVIVVPDDADGAFIPYLVEAGETFEVRVNHVDPSGSIWEGEAPVSPSPLSLFYVAYKEEIGAALEINGNLVVFGIDGEGVLNGALVQNKGSSGSIVAQTQISDVQFMDAVKSGNSIFVIANSRIESGSTPQLTLYKLNGNDLSRDKSFGTDGEVGIGRGTIGGKAEAGFAIVPKIQVDANGYLYILWMDGREGNLWTDLLLSKVDPKNGSELWAINVTEAEGVQSYTLQQDSGYMQTTNPMALDEIEGKVVVCWQDYRLQKNSVNLFTQLEFTDTAGIMAQFVDMSNGNRQSEPVVISSMASFEVMPSVITIPPSSFVSWMSFREVLVYDGKNFLPMYVNRIDNLPTEITAAALVSGTTDQVAISGTFGPNPLDFYDNYFANEDYSKVEVNGVKVDIVSWATDEVVVRIDGGVVGDTDYDIVVTAYGQASSTWDYQTGAGGPGQTPVVVNLEAADNYITFNYTPPVGVSSVNQEMMNIFILTPSGRHVTIKRAATTGFNKVELDRNIFSSAGLYKVKIYYGNTYIGEIVISYLGR
jgi:hypothetical protein